MAAPLEIRRPAWRALAELCRLPCRARGPAAFAACALVAAGLAASMSALAQTSPLLEAALGPAASSEEPMLLQADEMIYDHRNNLVVAEGNVEIYFGNYTLLADRLIYDQSANILEADGNVRIRQPDGALIYADRMTLTDDFRDGFIRSLRIVTEEDMRIGAARAVRHDAETTVFDRAVLTPCRPCEDDPDKPPTWQVRATRVIHKKSEQTLTYENAYFDLFGYPVAWFPWFKHADPTVKRKSGFLMPSYGHSTTLGHMVEVPYHFALSPHYDFTLMPRYTEKQGVLWRGQWRQRTLNGVYFVHLDGIWEEDPLESRLRPNDKTISPNLEAEGVDIKSILAGLDPDRFRGSVRTWGDFAINEFWNWGWNVTLESDNAYRRYYDIDKINPRERISQLYLTGLNDRNHLDARVYHFGPLIDNNLRFDLRQEIRTGVSDARIAIRDALVREREEEIAACEAERGVAIAEGRRPPKCSKPLQPREAMPPLVPEPQPYRYAVHPVVDHNYILSEPVWGGELSFNSNVVSLTRDTVFPDGDTMPPMPLRGVDSHRFSSDMKWRRQLVDPLGQVFTPFFGARGDVYQVSDGIDPFTWNRRAVLTDRDLSGVRFFENDTITRGMAHAGVEYRYPFVANSWGASHVVEPIAQIIARPSAHNPAGIPNEDALSLVFDDTLLFDIDKFSGRDLMDGGTRADVGVRYTMQRHGGGYLQAVLGQSLHLAGDNPFPAESGLDTSQSDYVVGLYAQPVHGVTLTAQGRFDDHDLELRRADVRAAAGYGPLSGSVTYANLKAQPAMGIMRDREEILTRANLHLTEYWSVFGYLRYDLERARPVTDGIGLKYADDCLAISLVYHESFIRDEEAKLEPEQKIMLRVNLKYLGPFVFQSDASLLEGLGL